MNAAHLAFLDGMHTAFTLSAIMSMVFERVGDFIKAGRRPAGGSAPPM